MTSPEPLSGPRREQVLEAAVQVFGRYGFRKASMDEVARAAQISRPGLYLYFPSKEALFRAAMQKELDTAFSEASAFLDDAEAEPPDRFVAALDAWIGRYLGTSIGSDVGDLLEHSVAQLGSMFADYSARFEVRFAEAIAEAVPEPVVSPADVAATLIATGNGWKHQVASRPEFVSKMTVAVDLFHAGLRKEAP
jgi:AcrR family transcriptional regulator